MEGNYQGSPLGLSGPPSAYLADEWLYAHILRGITMAKFQPGKFGFWYEDFPSLTNWTAGVGAPTLVAARGGVVELDGTAAGSAVKVEMTTGGFFAAPTDQFYIASRLIVTAIVAGSFRVGFGTYNIANRFSMGASSAIDATRYSTVAGGATFPNLISPVLIDTNYHDLEMACDGKKNLRFQVDDTGIISGTIGDASTTPVAANMLVNNTAAGAGGCKGRCDKILIMVALP